MDCQEEADAMARSWEVVKVESWASREAMRARRSEVVCCAGASAWESPLVVGESSCAVDVNVVSRWSLI